MDWILENDIIDIDTKPERSPDSWERLKADCAGCMSCELGKTRTNLSPSAFTAPERLGEVVAMEKAGA